MIEDINDKDPADILLNVEADGAMRVEIQLTEYVKVKGTFDRYCMKVIAAKILTNYAKAEASAQSAVEALIDETGNA